MNNQKICFIICANDSLYESECIHYLNHLIVPDGYELDCITIHDAKSMTSGYNEGMRASDAKYKIYIHQDVFLVNPNLLTQLLHIFENPSIGMVGAVGSRILPSNAVMWDGPRVGSWCEVNLIGTEQYGSVSAEREYELVEAVDGAFIATQYDLPWREDLFTGWDFYDISQCFEFHRAGYQIAVSCPDFPWLLHDAEIPALTNYYDCQQVFLQEYGSEMFYNLSDD